MAARLEEIRQAKAERAEKAKKAQTPVYQGGYKPVIANSYGTKAGPANPVRKEADKPKVVQPTLFDNADDLPFEEGYDIPYGHVSFDKVTLKSLVLQLITGSIIISNDSKIDITKWLSQCLHCMKRGLVKAKLAWIISRYGQRPIQSI